MSLRGNGVMVDITSQSIKLSVKSTWIYIEMSRYIR